MDPRQQPIYISTDVEFNGGVPSAHSLVSIGAVAYRDDGKELGRFFVNVKPLPNHGTDKRCMDFWKQYPKMWGSLQQDQQEPEKAMQDFAAWVKGFTGKPILAAQPLKIEKAWLDYYFKEFGIESPFEEELCMRDILLQALDMLDNGEDNSVWESSHPYTHNPLDDAIYQGESLMNVLKWMRNRQPSAAR